MKTNFLRIIFFLGGLSFVNGCLSTHTHPGGGLDYRKTENSGNSSCSPKGPCACCGSAAKTQAPTK